MPFWKIFKSKKATKENTEKQQDLQLFFPVNLAVFSYSLFFDV